MTKFDHLQTGILALSQSDDWMTACLEWELSAVYFDENGSTCLCTHTPIREVCRLTNRLTGTSTEVGNCCVKKFLDLPSGSIFDGIKRIQEDTSKALNKDAIAFFHRKGFLTDWDAGFCENTCLKRTLSAKQSKIRLAINKKVLAKLQIENRQRLSQIRI